MQGNVFWFQQDIVLMLAKLKAFTFNFFFSNQHCESKHKVICWDNTQAFLNLHFSTPVTQKSRGCSYQSEQEKKANTIWQFLQLCNQLYKIQFHYCFSQFQSVPSLSFILVHLHLAVILILNPIRDLRYTLYGGKNLYKQQCPKIFSHNNTNDSNSKCAVEQKTHLKPNMIHKSQSGYLCKGTTSRDCPLCPQCLVSQSGLTCCLFYLQWCHKSSSWSRWI